MATSDSIRIFVRSESEATGGRLELRVDPSDTVLSLKEKISKLKGIPAQQQCLDFRGSYIYNDDTFAELEVKDGALICLSSTRDPVICRQGTPLQGAVGPPLYGPLRPSPIQGVPPTGLHMGGARSTDLRLRRKVVVLPLAPSVARPHPVLGGLRPAVLPPRPPPGDPPGWEAGGQHSRWMRPLPPPRPAVPHPIPVTGGWPMQLCGQQSPMMSAPPAPTTVLLPPRPPPRDPRLRQGLGGPPTHVPWQPPLPEEPYPDATQSGSEAEEILPPLPPGSPPPASIQALATGQSSLPAGPHAVISESNVLAEEAPPPPPPGSPPPSNVQGTPSTIENANGREGNASHRQPSTDRSQHESSSLHIPAENQQQASSLRIITNEVTGPHNSPVDEGGHFIDKGKGDLYVRKTDVSDQLLPVYEKSAAKQTASKADNKENDKDSLVHQSPEPGLHQGTSAQSVEADQLHQGRNATSSTQTSSEEHMSPSSKQTSSDEQMSPSSKQTSSDEHMSPSSNQTSSDEQVSPSSTHTSSHEQVAPSSGHTSSDEQVVPSSTHTSSDEQVVPRCTQISSDDVDYYLEEETGDLYVGRRRQVVA
ncbi:g2122 [Coccomyxa elongata]